MSSGSRKAYCSPRPQRPRTGCTPVKLLYPPSLLDCMAYPLVYWFSYLPRLLYSARQTRGHENMHTREETPFKCVVAKKHEEDVEMVGWQPTCMERLKGKTRKLCIASPYTVRCTPSPCVPPSTSSPSSPSLHLQTPTPVFRSPYADMSTEVCCRERMGQTVEQTVEHQFVHAYG